MIGTPPPPLPARSVASGAPTDSFKTVSVETAKRMLLASQKSGCKLEAIQEAALNKNFFSCALNFSKEFITFLDEYDIVESGHVDAREIHENQDPYRNITAASFHAAITKCTTPQLSYDIRFALKDGTSAQGEAVIHQKNGDLYYYETFGNQRSKDILLFQNQTIANFKSKPSPISQTHQHIAELMGPYS